MYIYIYIYVCVYMYVLYTHMQIHAEHNDTMKMSDTVF